VREKVNFPKAPMVLLFARDVAAMGLSKRKRKLLKRTRNKRDIN